MDLEKAHVSNRRLRQILRDNGIGWMAEQVDAAVTAGVFEQKRLRQTSRGGVISYEEVMDSRSISGGEDRTRARGEEFVSRRAMTEEEQFDVITQAIRRIFVDTAKVAKSNIFGAQ
jgi:hypothetical protein